ncbi:MAG: hypothetical protein OIN66_16980 [Candidatus Methanoperedens sp.]|nr:hypothetical protein [Candidatus Methanoperedens sp.]
MSPRKVWVFDPDSGGIKIPDSVKNDVERRINNISQQHFKGKYTHLDIRFKGQFCYIDAFQEPEVSEDWHPKDWPETREEYIERLRKTPTHLCRLRYFGNDRWGFAFYTYSNEKYELSVFPDGEFFGKPEDAFMASAVYLNG